MPKEAPGALPLPRSQHRGSLPQFRPQATHQPPTTYHHVQQYLPRPPGYQYYPAPATFAPGQNDPPTSSAPSSQSSALANYEHALKMAPKFDRGALGSAYTTQNFKVASYDQRSLSPASSPQTSVSHKSSSYDRTSNALAGYRSNQAISGSPYDHKMSMYTSALPYDRFSKKKLAAHVSEKSASPYGRNDKKTSRHSSYASSSYDRPVKPAPVEGDKGAGRSYYERRVQRQEAERQMDAYDAQSSSPYERPPSSASSFERLTTAPTTPYDRLTSTAAYERRAVFDRAYEAAAYDRRLYALTGGLGGSYYAVSTPQQGAGDDSAPSFNKPACTTQPPVPCACALPVAWLSANVHSSDTVTPDHEESIPGPDPSEALPLLSTSQTLLDSSSSSTEAEECTIEAMEASSCHDPYPNERRRVMNSFVLDFLKASPSQPTVLEKSLPPHGSHDTRPASYSLGVLCLEHSISQDTPDYLPSQRTEDQESKRMDTSEFAPKTSLVTAVEMSPMDLSCPNGKVSPKYEQESVDALLHQPKRQESYALSAYNCPKSPCTDPFCPSAHQEMHSPDASLLLPIPITQQCVSSRAPLLPMRQDLIHAPSLINQPNQYWYSQDQTPTVAPQAPLLRSCFPSQVLPTSAWQYPYPSYNSDIHLIPQFTNRDRPEEYEAKEPATYPAKPRMSLLTSAEYLSSLSRRTQQSDEGARSGHPSVIVPPSRSPADSSPRKTGKNETLPPLTIDTSSSPKADLEKPSIYMPTVEPISPTSPPDPSGEDGADGGGSGAPKSSAKDSLLVEISRVDREIQKIEHQVINLNRKQSELEQKAKKSETESSEETTEAPLPQHFSLSHKVYSENRRKAKENHAGLGHLGPSVDLPLYNQPSDTSTYQENKLRHLLFKGRLIQHLRRRRQDKFKQEKEMTADYALRTENWNRLVEKMENSPERKRRDVEYRELFEKVFPKIRKEREDRERFLRVGSRVKSDADLEEIMDNLHEQEMEVKKMRDYAAVPPMLLSAESRRCVYVNTNGRLEDFETEYKERRLFNIWTDAEKDIFREKYLVYPKNFGAIASFLERKSVSDCVQYYYLSKKTENYKRLLKKSGQKSKSGRNRNKTTAPPPLDPAPSSTPPGPTIAPRFQRDYKPTSEVQFKPEAPQYKPEIPPVKVEAAMDVDEDAEGPTLAPPLTPPAEPAPFVPVAVLPPATVPTTVSTPELAGPQQPQQQQQQQQFQHVVHKPPPHLKPLMLPHLPDIPIVVIDDSDDSNSGSHFPFARK